MRASLSVAIVSAVLRVRVNRPDPVTTKGHTEGFLTTKVNLFHNSRFRWDFNRCLFNIYNN